VPTPIKIYWAIEDAKRPTFNAAFSGNEELPWRAVDTNGGFWRCYPGSYHDTEVADRQAEFAVFEAWFRVVEPNAGVMILGNDPGFAPYAPDTGFQAFLESCGLTIVQPESLPLQQQGGGTIVLIPPQGG